MGIHFSLFCWQVAWETTNKRCSWLFKKKMMLKRWHALLHFLFCQDSQFSIPMKLDSSPLLMNNPWIIFFPQAIDFAKEQDDEDLWDDLINYSLDKPGIHFILYCFLTAVVSPLQPSSGCHATGSVAWHPERRLPFVRTGRLERTTVVLIGVNGHGRFGYETF